ncbi:T9SS type B sorting domain-containing protein [Arenibacter amylolyticus]|uniref:T9SS type B sorting domain-containing protein n=1 Tax=Arenibacter amylolyticus TaxID=1406873 RepID=UPI001FE51839|nr:gliding motility-associated C-terminal domain-containing protein [Arenibacter amylolyticus]
MKSNPTYRYLVVTLLFALLNIGALSAQFLLQAPNSSDEHNYKWYEASDRNTVLGTDFYYEVTQPGIYFATYDGTLCGSNASGYFIVTDCSSPDNEVVLDVSSKVGPASSISWSPSISGDQLLASVTATQSVTKYTATVTKAGNSFDLPNFTVVCLQQAAILEDDYATVKEDESVVIPIYDNDSNIPTEGLLTTSNPFNGNVFIDDNGTPNDPSDDIVSFAPNPNFNGNTFFTYTICNAKGDCSTATVYVEVLPIVDAFNDTAVTMQNEAVEIDILANDDDIPLIATLQISSPANGTVVVNDYGTPNDIIDDTVTYTPDTDFVGTDNFTYTICDEDNNCSTASVTVLVNTDGTGDPDPDKGDKPEEEDPIADDWGEDVEVFNVITPNNDGIHDVLTIKAIENYPNNTIKIYNRWGVMVFSTRSYDNYTNNFDGTSKGRVTVGQDNKLPVGTYFYMLNISNADQTKNKTLTGYIYINR